MKKNYSIVSMVQAVIVASAFLFPVTIYSQDLTAAQRQERCQNNIKRLEELKTNLQVIEIELSQAWTDKDIEAARIEMVYVRDLKNTLMKNNPVYKNYADFIEKGGYEKVVRIGGKYNFNYDDCDNSQKTELECFAALEKIIADKIDSAVLSKTWTGKEIEEARNEIVYLRDLKDNLMKDIPENKNYVDFAQKGGYEKLVKIGKKYNFDYDDCDNDNQKNEKECFADLEKIIAGKIEKAVSFDRPALLAKKNEIDKQIANHRTNLIALGCDNINKNNTEEFIKKLVGAWTAKSTPWGTAGGGCQIKYANGKLILINENQKESGASLSLNNDGSAVINASNWPVTGTVDKAEKSIKWSNGSEWVR